jgi:hypothetical protein
MNNILKILNSEAKLNKETGSLLNVVLAGDRGWFCVGIERAFTLKYKSKGRNQVINPPRTRQFHQSYSVTIQREAHHEISRMKIV